MRESMVHEEVAAHRTTAPSAPATPTAPNQRTSPSALTRTATPRTATRAITLRTATHAIGDGARRIDAATPAERDRAVDALRAFAILGVVLGHWLVTALVADGGALHTASPLQHMPWLAPISWVFQTLAVFFLVGGHVATKSYASARARGTTYGPWLRTRLTRLFKPVAAVLTLWTVATVGLLASGTGVATVHTLVKLALSPLWFLLVFAGLTAATPCSPGSTHRGRWPSFSTWI